MIKHLTSFLLLISSAASNTASGEFILELDVNRGINSNLFLETDEFRKKPIDSDEIVRDTQTQISISTGYQVSQSDKYSAALLLDLFRESLKENDQDIQAATISLPASFQFGNFKLASSLSNTQYKLSDEDILQHRKITLTTSQQYSYYEPGLILTGINKISDNDEHKEYQGHTSAISIFNRFDLGSSDIKLALDLFRDKYQNEANSNKGYQTAIKFRRFNDKHSFFLGYGLKHRQYEENPFGSYTREEWRWKINYHHDYHLSSNSDIYIDISHLRNRSNIRTDTEDYNYRQWISSIGFRYVY